MQITKNRNEILKNMNLIPLSFSLIMRIHRIYSQLSCKTNSSVNYVYVVYYIPST